MTSEPAPSFFDVKSSQLSRPHRGVQPQASASSLASVCPTNMSPVRWKKQQPTAVSSNTTNTNASTQRSEGMSTATMDKGRRSLPPRGGNEFATRSEALSQAAAAPAALPQGWQPASDEFDNVVTHRLWRLDDDSNLLTMPHWSQRLAASNETSQTGASKFLSSTPPPLRLKSSATTSNPGGGAVDNAQSSQSLSVATEQSAVPGHRPVSGDPLLRRYQLSTLLTIAHRSSMAANHGRANAAGSAAFYLGSSSPTKPRVGESLPPRAATSTRLTSLLPSNSFGTTINGSQPLQVGSAQRRINSAAARIAAVAASLGSESLPQYPQLTSALQKAAEQQEQRSRGGGGSSRETSPLDRSSDGCGSTATSDRRTALDIPSVVSSTWERSDVFPSQSMSSSGMVPSPLTFAGRKHPPKHSRHQVDGGATCTGDDGSPLGGGGWSPESNALGSNSSNSGACTFDAPSTVFPPSAFSSPVAAAAVPEAVSGIAALRSGGPTVVITSNTPSPSRHTSSVPSHIHRTKRQSAVAFDDTFSIAPAAARHMTDSGTWGRDMSAALSRGASDAFVAATTSTFAVEDDAMLLEAAMGGLLTAEDLCTLAELTGAASNIMNEGAITDDVWYFETQAISAAAKESLLQSVSGKASRNLRSESSTGLNVADSQRRPSRRSGANQQRRSTNGDNSSSALQQKLQLLERLDEVGHAPVLELQSFDVLSSDLNTQVQIADKLMKRRSDATSGLLRGGDEASDNDDDNAGDTGVAAPDSVEQAVRRAHEGLRPIPLLMPPAASVGSSHAARHREESDDTVSQPSSAVSLERRIRSNSSHGVHRGPPSASIVVPLTSTAVADVVLPRTKSIVDFFGSQGKTVVPEGETFIPTNELHLYQLFCLNTNMIIIFRPVSPSVPPMYAGNFFLDPQYCDSDGIPLTINEIDPNMTLQEVLRLTRSECRVKGKGIGVSLKSSPYPPIDGFIPINPSLSKTYSEARKKERALEDNLINAAGGGGEGMSTALLKKMRSQKSLFSAATSVAMKEIEASLKDSDQRLKKLLEDYHVASSYAIDKLAVAEEYIGVLNESQFLGKTIATWRGMQIYYKQAPGDADVERRENAHPVLYCKRNGELIVYDLERNELNLKAVVPASEVESMTGTLYHPVYILTHKSFVVSPISKRIEADPLGDFLIGPDFDGFAYATWVGGPAATASTYKHFANQQMQLRVLPTFGLVNDLDIEHILEMRRLTEWKQSHGYECSNTLKTQEISDGPHVIVMPNELRIASTFEELMAFYREAWQCGYPLLLNPNWKVVLSPQDHLPVTLGDELNIPIVDDCGLAITKHQLTSVGKKFDDVKEEALKYTEELVALRKQGVTRLRVAGLYSTSLIPKVAAVLARKHLADTFFWLRRWLLFPPMFDPSKLNSFDDEGQRSSSPSAGGGAAALGMSRRPSAVFTAGSGGKKERTVPVVAEFERYREARIAEWRARFEEECGTFDAIFGGEDPKFTKRLRQFTDPLVATQAAIAHEAAIVAQQAASTGKSFLTTADHRDAARAPESGAMRGVVVTPSSTKIVAGGAPAKRTPLDSLNVAAPQVSALRSAALSKGEFVSTADSEGEKPFL